MFGLFSKKAELKEASIQYVKNIFLVGRATCPMIDDVLKKASDGKYTFPSNDEASLEVSIAILGISIACLQGNTTFMTVKEGNYIEKYCLCSINEDYSLAPKISQEINDKVMAYNKEFHAAMKKGCNPFLGPSGIMIVHCMGIRANSLCLPGTTSLNPLYHQVIGDLMMNVVTSALKFWKVFASGPEKKNS